MSGAARDVLIKLVGQGQATWIERHLEEAGFIICRMGGGVHTGSCPTCGCEPQHGWLNEQSAPAPPAPA